MSRHLYPGTLIQLSGGGGAPAPNLPVSVWTDLFTGTDVTGQLVGSDNVSAYAAITDGQGNLPAFRGPEGYVGNLFVDSGVGMRYLLISPTVIDALVAALSSVGITVHGALSGLGADDHPQYLTAGRGDARYPLSADVDLRILLAGQTASTADRNRANHTGQQPASTISDFAAAVAAVAGSGGGSASVARDTDNVPYLTI